MSVEEPEDQPEIVFLSTISIYILPSEEGLAPRALIANGFSVPVAAVYDDGEWKIEDNAVTEELGQIITEHAESLGVEL